jgi:hypothetical protein
MKEGGEEGRREAERGETGGPRGKPEVGQGLCVRTFQSRSQEHLGGRGVCEATTRGLSRKRKSSDRLRHDTEPLRD